MTMKNKKLEMPKGTITFNLSMPEIKFDPALLKVNPVKPYRITIECDGDTTTAKMIVNGKEVKTATAKRNPADKANWRIGAQTAFDRLWKKQEKPEEQKKDGVFKVGDRVVCTQSYFQCFNMHGRIVDVDNDRWLNIAVEFDNHFPGGHTCGCTVKHGHGYWLNACSLAHEQPTKQKVCDCK